MADIKVDIEASCTCGKNLTVEQDTWTGSIKVEPCEKCLEEKYSEGYRDRIKEEE